MNGIIFGIQSTLPLFLKSSRTTNLRITSWEVGQIISLMVSGVRDTSKPVCCRESLGAKLRCFKNGLPHTSPRQKCNSNLSTPAAGKIGIKPTIGSSVHTTSLAQPCPHHFQVALRPEISKHAVCRQIKYRNDPYQYMVTARIIFSVYSTAALRRIERPCGAYEVASLLSGKVKVGFSLPSAVGLQVVAQLPGPCKPCTWATTQLRPWCIHVTEGNNEKDETVYIRTEEKEQKGT